MATTYILDGYNLIRHLPQRVRDRGTGADQRHAIEHELRRFRTVAGPGTRICLVYDGEGGLPAATRGEKGFEIHFSKPPAQADDVVLDMARRLEGTGDVCIVTSDFADITSRLLGLRVRHMTSQEFAALLERKVGSAGRAEPSSEKPTTLVPSEVNDWLQQFGFDAASDLGTEGRK